MVITKEELEQNYLDNESITDSKFNKLSVFAEIRIEHMLKPELQGVVDTDMTQKQQDALKVAIMCLMEF